MVYCSKKLMMVLVFYLAIIIMLGALGFYTFGNAQLDTKTTGAIMGVMVGLLISVTAWFLKGKEYVEKDD
jgi:hypothetical protein